MKTLIIISIPICIIFFGCNKPTEEFLENPRRIDTTHDNITANIGFGTTINVDTTQNDTTNIPIYAPPLLPPNFVVGAATLVEGSLINGTRLSTYKFKQSGSVIAKTYRWRQNLSNTWPRIGTGTIPDTILTGVRECEIQTGSTFMGPAPLSVLGEYTQTDSLITINWKGSSSQETWILRNHDNYSSFSLLSSNDITHGVGFGSSAEITKRKPIVSVLKNNENLNYDIVRWVNDELKTLSSAETWNMNNYTQSTTTTWVATYKQPSSSKHCQCPISSITSIQYYLQQITSHDRRDTWWHWCTCLADDRGEVCYKGNSHIKMMLQIIDDSNKFRGWVGVESSFYPGNKINPRLDDQLGVFHISSVTPWRN